MARKNRRRRGRGTTSIPYARMRPIEDWKVGGSAVDATGAVIGGASPTGPATWLMGAGSATILATGVPITFQAVALIAAPNTSTPTLGRMRLDDIKGSIFLGAPASATVIRAAVGIYVSEYNSNTGKWDVRDPLNTADGSRDDYFYLEGQMFDLPATGTSTAPTIIKFDLRLSERVVIGGGQALHVTVSAVGANISLNSAFRTLVGPVA